MGEGTISAGVAIALLSAAILAAGKLVSMSIDKLTNALIENTLSNQTNTTALDKNTGSKKE